MMSATDPPTGSQLHWSVRRSSGRSNAVLGVVDQGLSSLTNLAAVLAAAATLSVTEFGIFAAVYAAYLIASGASQALVSQDLVLAFGDEPDMAQRMIAAMAFTACFSAVPVAALLVSGFLLDGLGPSLIALALLTPFLLVQDTIRFGCSILGSMRLAVVLDAVWGALLIAGVWTVSSLLDVPRSSLMLTLLWGAAGAVSGILGVLLIVRHLPRSGPLNLRDEYLRRDFLGLRFLVEFLAVRGSSQALALILGALAGIAATGALRGATTLFGPLTMLLLAASTFAIPVIRSQDRAHQDRILISLATGLALLAGAMTVAFLAIPDTWGERLLGQTWAIAEPLILPVGLQVMALALSSMGYTALRMSAPTKTLSLRLIGALVQVVFFFGGYQIDGVQGAVWGLAAAAGAQAGLNAASYARESRTVRAERKSR